MLFDEPSLKHDMNGSDQRDYSMYVTRQKNMYISIQE